ncbi:hypothetical protein C8Q74DRAFT_276481 [Fomes fomentarius]|nr:hypothetical protein C8Q74DRAFT_276481 [Fomes fomentarius]
MCFLICLLISMPTIVLGLLAARLTNTITSFHTHLLVTTVVVYQFHGYYLSSIVDSYLMYFVRTRVHGPPFTPCCILRYLSHHFQCPIYPSAYVSTLSIRFLRVRIRLGRALYATVIYHALHLIAKSTLVLYTNSGPSPAGVYIARQHRSLTWHASLLCCAQKQQSTRRMLLKIVAPTRSARLIWHEDDRGARCMRAPADCGSAHSNRSKCPCIARYGRCQPRHMTPLTVAAVSHPSLDPHPHVYNPL